MRKRKKHISKCNSLGINNNTYIYTNILLICDLLRETVVVEAVFAAITDIDFALIVFCALRYLCVCVSFNEVD